MTFKAFEHLARLHVIGALDPAERDEFRAARGDYGDRAEAFICDCRKLNSALALSLRPLPPSPETRERLLQLISSTPCRSLTEKGRA